MAGVPRVVVVGNGMAGFRFAQELLALGPGFDVTVVGDEPGGAYNRAQLPGVLAGTVREDSIELADEDWYAVRGARLMTGVAACRIDRGGQRLELADGSAVPYDVLVLATGSEPALPPVGGLVERDGRLLTGAVAFRTLADCAQIRALVNGARHAVVLGGGVLGLETACALTAAGLPVTLVHRGPRLMERQLDAGAARVLARTVRSAGVAVRTGAAVREVRSIRAVGGAGHLTGIVLDDGEVLGADLFIICCGTRPRTELARAADLAIGAGVIVDDQMRSVTDGRIFAIGDCAEHRGRTHGLIAPAWAQARVAAMAVTGRDTGDTGYVGQPAVVRLKAAGIELAALGSARGGGGAEVIRFTDPARGVYQKLVVRDGRLAGAILLGDTRTAGTITQLLDRGTTLPADRSALLVASRDGTAPAADSPVRLPGHATICQCNGVTKAAICAAWQDGARDAGQVAARTRASTGCGTCRDAVEGIMAWLAAAEPGLVPA
ncbi:MAG: NAD(P)/FAD-dependent oxidoreductase [Streptosporangiaceae bacterium]|nr:NAD(P)/FAD-dependent oxidoreductase [Streptosporangiaceae bacterium]